MTLANARRLLKHFEDTNQTQRAKEQKQFLENKTQAIKDLMKDPRYPHSKYRAEFAEKPKEKPKEEKQDGKKSA